ncbi:hypothetical protein Efla_007096 [Eimeria flavescens]
MCWMHRGAAACAVELVEGRETDKFLRFFISMVSLLRYYGVTPLIVFDGSRIDVKSGEDEKRRLRRESAKREALELLERKRKNLPVDYKELMSRCSQSISITPAMVDKVIAACRELGIRCLVAPYEADAQLAYLSRTNQIHSAISEDSDLLAYGCKRVMLKMDKDGKCDVIRLPFLQDENDRPQVASREPKTAKQQELIRCLAGLNHERFVAMCVLGGCDYTNHVHINGMGIATACRLVTQLRTLKRVLDFLCRDKKWSSRFPAAKEEVIKGHLEAERTFMEHKVFDPRTRRVVLVRTLDTQSEEAGPEASSEEARARCIEISSGLIDPRTGALRQTELCPAECELIRECQERAFSGLEAQQLKAQAAAYKAEALRKQEEERARREAASASCFASGMVPPADVAVSATTVVRIKTSSLEEGKNALDEPKPARSTAAAVTSLDALAADTAATVTSRKSFTCVSSSESIHLAKRLLHEIAPQGLQLHSMAAAASAVVQQLGLAEKSETPGCPEAQAFSASGDTAASTEAKDFRGSQSSGCSAATCSFSQFAFNWQQANPGSEPPQTRTRRRDVVTRTRFAYRTKLVSSVGGQRCLPFPSLTSTGGLKESAELTPATAPTSLKGLVTNAQAFKPEAKRKAGGFICSDDTEAASAFMNIRFSQEEPKKHKFA